MTHDDPRRRPNPQLVVFDFDGTLADTLSAVLATLTRVAAERGRSVAAPLDKEHFRVNSLATTISAVGAAPFELPVLLERVRRELASSMETIPPFPGAAAALRRLKDMESEVALWTSNSSGNVRRFLAANGLEALIDRISADIPFDRKAEALSVLIRESGAPQKAVIAVGDEARDIVAARGAGVDCIAVSWGFNARAVLARERPLAVVDDWASLIDALSNAALLDHAAKTELRE